MDSNTQDQTIENLQQARATTATLMTMLCAELATQKDEVTEEVAKVLLGKMLNPDETNELRGKLVLLGSCTQTMYDIAAEAKLRGYNLDPLTPQDLQDTLRG